MLGILTALWSSRSPKKSAADPSAPFYLRASTSDESWYSVGRRLRRILALAPVLERAPHYPADPGQFDIILATATNFYGFGAG